MFSDAMLILGLAVAFMPFIFTDYLFLEVVVIPTNQGP